MQQMDLLAADASATPLPPPTPGEGTLPKPIPGPSEYITSQKPIGTKGSPTARILIVGEAPGADEMRKGLPFVGASGKELDKMLADAGIIKYVKDPTTGREEPDYSNVFFTNVTLIRPPNNEIEKWVKRASPKTGKVKPTLKGKNKTPEHWVKYREWLVEPHVAKDAQLLLETIKKINPTVVIALGNTPFWALCKEGITGKVGTWRGSTLLSDCVDGLKVVVAYHPAFILRQWKHRHITVQDFRRAAHASLSREMENPGWEFTIAPTYDQAAAFLTGLLYRLEEGPVKLTCDIEGAQKKLLCIAIGVSAKQAICIPVRYRSGFWFPPDRRYVIHYLLYKVLSHKNARVIGQNIGFDTQFTLNDLLIYPNIFWDTMIAQNVLWPGTPKSLAYQASMYCAQYRYWKDDSDEFWKKKRISNWEEIWFYNCEDAARTFEVQEQHEKFLAARNLRAQFDRLQNRTFRLIRKIMFRGVRVDKGIKAEMAHELLFVINMAQERVNFLASRQLDVSSPVQLQDFFYKEMKLKPILNEEDRPTCDADALVLLAEREPLVREIVRWINLCRSYVTGVSVCEAETDEDGRWRSSISLGLVETYRLSSSKNPYGRGLNLMNITGGKDVKDGEDD